MTSHLVLHRRHPLRGGRRVARLRSWQGRSRTLWGMSQPRSDRLSAARVASHLGVMLAVAAVMGVVVAGLAIPFAGVLGVGARNVARGMDDLPAELETGDLAQRTRILDSKGKLITTLYDENRISHLLSQ